MSVMIMSEYSLVPGRRDDFLELLRVQQDQVASGGSLMTALEVVSGGESSGHIAVNIEFATALERGKYVDAISVAPEQDALAQALWATSPPAVLVARYSANGIPLAGAPLINPPAVFSDLRMRIAPGRHAEANAAIDEFKRNRDGLGIACQQWALVSAGTYHGVRILSTSAASFVELASQQERVNAFSAERGSPNGALSQAQQSGVVTVIESRTSRLIAELAR